MQINCLACGHKVDIGDAYDDYEGQVKCWVCGGLLDIKTEEGTLKSVKFVSLTRPSEEEVFKRTR